jgi:methyl-accepting chemotaxis protein
MFGNNKKDKEIEELKKRISQLEKEKLEDINILFEIEKMIEHIENGFFMYEITKKSSNEQIESVKNKINLLSKNLQMKISSISNVLLDFGVSHFESRVDEKIIMTGAYGSLKSSTRLIGNNVSELLAMIMNSGEKLNSDTTILSNFSSLLSEAANKQAVSLEETAAALEEISSTISHNTQSIENMNLLATDVHKSVIVGEKLANQTTIAMEEINGEVTTINEAISVIDKIAFQTNILSLNAAVEAATAGEAGRGFAVVAAEVRNLANRSAEAAKEIKIIVENATSKANQGKQIANNMIKGYQELSKKIDNTISLISEIKDSSKEQEVGIHQINDAVNDLDKVTQENAMQANHINSLSHDVSELSTKLVQAACLAEYSKQTKEYVCNVDLVYKTAKLKNDHIRFKETNFAKLGKNETWQVVSHHDCALGKWIDESEKEYAVYTKTPSWSKLKEYHENIHKSVQTYIYEDVKSTPETNLGQLANNIEILTQHIFDELNMVKKNLCSKNFD